MAEHADGSIIVDTEIDAQGFKAGSSELQRAIKSLNTKMEALGPAFQKALSGNASAISTFDAKAAALESTISDIEAKMESLGGKRVPTEHYQWLTTEIEKAKNELMKLDEKQVKMEATGVKQNSRAWQSLQYDIDLAKRKIAEYEGEQASMRSDGTAFQMGSSTAEYSQLESALASAKDRLAEMQGQAEAARGSTSRLAQIGNTIKSVFGKIGAVGKKAFTGFVNGVKNGISKLKQFSKSSGGCMGAISKLGKKLTGLGSMLKRMALRKVMSAIITAVKDGFNNLAQYSSQTNADMSALKSSLTQLKNSFAAAFAPILTVVTPILTKLIGYLSTALTYIGKLFAALSGAKTFTKATAVQEDYAASLSGTGKAAKDAQKQLAGFDELNVLSDSSSDSGGGGAGSVDPSEMFEEVPIESSITDFIGSLKEAFKSGDYAGIGEIIGNGINTAVQNVNDFIRWDNVGSKITAGIKGVAQGFNALVDTVDWKLIGDTCAQGFNTAINTIFLVLTEFDWPGLAAGLAQYLNGIVSGIDWGKLGTTLSTGLSTAIATLRSAITTFDWASLGKGIADALDNIDWVGLLSDLAGGISDILKAALDLLIGFAENLDWGKLGRDLWNGLIGIITNIDWSGIISKAFRLLGAALGGCVALIVEFCKELWESLKAGFESTKSYFNKYIEEAGGNVVQGIWNGIVNALKNVGNWIVENIWNPFIEGFKNAFGIHSPSTKMAEMGNYIVEGLLNGIKNVWHTITDFFSGALDGIKNTISTAWTNIKNGASTAWTNIKSTLSTAWEGIKTTASTKWNNLKTTISTGWNNIKTGATTAWTNIKSSLSTAWDGIKTTATTKWNNLKTTISTAWDSVKTTASTKWAGIKTSLSTAWDGIKTTASTKWNNLKTTISTAWDNVKTTASSKWSTIKTTLSTAWDGIKTAASTKWDSLKSTISTKWDNIKSNATSTWSTIKSNLSSTWDTIKSTASSKWDSIKSTIQNKGWSGIGSNICDGIKSGINSGWTALKNKVSEVATSLLDEVKAALGIHSPSRLFRDIVGLNIGYGIGEGIEASEGSVVDSVTGLADAIAAEANAGEYNIGGVVSTSEVDGALTGFADKISNSFTNLLDRLQAIANGVTFAVPAMATGTVMPYSVSAAAQGGGNGVTSAIEASNEELGSIIIQAVTNATAAIVDAIQEYGGTTVNLDERSLSSSVIKEINRRTRMAGKSPLYGV